MTDGQTVSVVEIRNVLLATVPPHPGDTTIDQLQQRILTAIEDADPAGVILDISNVQTMDSFFARTVAETVHMVKLMGSETIVVGMQPSVAITATELGYSLADVQSALSTDDALDMLANE